MASSNPGIVRSVAKILIVFFAVLINGGVFHDSDAMGASPISPTVDPGYRLGAEDVMLISLWKDEHLTKEH